MNIFNNVSLRGTVVSVREYVTEDYMTIFIKLSIFKYRKENRNYYQNINAQISCETSKYGIAPNTEENYKTAIKNIIYDKLNTQLEVGDLLTVQGELCSNEQIYLNDQWINATELPFEDRRNYFNLTTKDIISRNSTYIKIEDIYLKDKIRKEQVNIDMEENQADIIETDDNDPVDNDGVVIAEVEATQLARKSKGYTKFENMIRPE